VKKTLSQGLDGKVKTIYSPLPCAHRATFFESFIVKSAHLITSNQPEMGGFAFVPGLPMTASMKPWAGRTNALHLGLPTSFRGLDRHEDPMPPGEGSATI
jgi:hypothetical protein